MGNSASAALCKKFGTKVTVGRIDLGFANRLIIDDSEMLDHNGKQMLRVSRISVKVNLLALLNGRIEITSAQFFGLKANLYKATSQAQPNFQFVIDSLASKDTTNKSKPLDLQINSLIIRNSGVKYKCLYKASQPHKFSTSDLNATDISAHFIVNRITNDSLNVKIKRLSLKEQKGLDLKKLSLQATIGSSGARLENMQVSLPNSDIYVKEISATYRTKDKQIEIPTLQYKGMITATKLAIHDIACFIPSFYGDTHEVLSLSTNFSGTGSSCQVNNFKLLSNMGLILNANGSVRNFPQNTQWALNLNELSVGNAEIAAIAKAFTRKDLPDVVNRLGHIRISGFAGGTNKNIASNGNIQTELGNVKFAFEKRRKHINAHVATQKFNIAKLTGNNTLGYLSADIKAEGTSPKDVLATGRIYDFNYNGYSYNNINVNASYRNKTLNGKIAIDDPNAKIALNGLVNLSSSRPIINAQAAIESFSPNTLGLTSKWRGTTFSCNIVADLSASNINDANGKIQIKDFKAAKPSSVYSIDNILVSAGNNKNMHFLNIDSDFGRIGIVGSFNYNTISRSVMNLLASKLPTMPGITYSPLKEHNRFKIDATLSDTKWLKEIMGVPLDIDMPLSMSGELDDRGKKIDLICDAPSFSYNGGRYKGASITISSPNDSISADIRIKKLMNKGKAMSLKLKAGASNNRLKTSLSFQNNEVHPLRGEINASTVFAKNEKGMPAAYINVLESKATIGDTTWQVSPSTIEYYKNHLAVDGFCIRHGKQYIGIDGIATKDTGDSLTVKLNDIDVSYVLNLINFHSVDFFGMASGEAYVAGAFTKTPQLAADLQVKDFKFETGRMGTLYAHVGYDDNEGNINIDATAMDEDNRKTLINGYVSPKHNFIDLGIKAQGTRAEFMESFCGSFMDNVDADINGEVNVVGPLSNINLVGKATVSGSVHMTTLNTTYWMHNDSVTFVPDEIIFKGDTLRDRNGNIGIMTGSVYHKHLTNLSYDLGIKAHNLLAYDTHTFDGNSFYGTAYVTGDCSIKGKSGEVVIDINAKPEKNSILVYNVSDHSTATSRDYIHWKKAPETKDTAADSDSTAKAAAKEKVELSTNIRLNFLVNCNTDATLKLLMDETTGDYITLNGDGVLRATYFNKGTFDLYGNYNIDHGVYKLTIQNIIKKDFLFQKGGTIAFGGDPYNASIDMKALYVLNSVNLSDLNIGRSFSNNNVRVNCLMNITGTPDAPKVDFSLDMPTLGNDAKQMIYSLLNAEEEMNQQVLYLLAVGRFYSQGNNNSSGNNAQYSQTSLAMQSFLSGTISQQINNVLSNVINSSNWNFGANISTGTEGFNDAEYEGLLSGRLLNNRLLINGQFGYRDNPNATTGFIGDFDLKYLLFPNGNLAINVYNKTNDRYFTRNTLNTQGFGIIMKKDFTRFTDLFFSRKKKKNR